MFRASVIILALGVTGWVGAEPPSATEQLRLWLHGGVYYDVRELQIKNGLVLFRTIEGRLSSISEDRVALITLIPEPQPAPAATGPASARDPAPSPVTYTNKDLPEPPPPVSVAGLTPGSDSLGAHRAPPPPHTDRIAEIDAALARAREEESLYYRLWACATNDLPLVGPLCNPRVRPATDPYPLSPTQKSLQRKAREARARIENLQARRDRAESEVGSLRD